MVTLRATNGACRTSIQTEMGNHPFVDRHADARRSQRRIDTVDGQQPRLDPLGLQDVGDWLEPEQQRRAAGAAPSQSDRR